MVVKSKTLFVLIGDDQTGKTTLQKILIDKICQKDYYTRLDTDLCFDIVHPEIKRKYKTISFANRSYQEKKEKYYKSVDNYFQTFFKDADIAFISSHLVESDIREMIGHGRRLFFNVIGVFWENSINVSHRNGDISLLDWNERLVIENSIVEGDEQIRNQLNRIADSIVILIINRTGIS